LQEVRTKATGARCTFRETFAKMITAAENEVYGASNMTVDTRLKHQVHLSDAEADATTRSVADTDRIANRLEREIYSITSNDEMRFIKELSIHLIKFEVCCNVIGFQELRETIEQRVIQFEYSNVHYVRHI